MSATRVNPVAKLAAALVICLCLLLTVDIVSAASALVLELALLPWAGMTARQLAVRTAPLWAAAPLAGLATALYGEASGAPLWQWGPVHISAGSLLLAVAITLRVLAIGVPGVVLLATSDPTDLADGLAQLVRLPARFVLGALAALRLVGLFLDDWRALGMARRARGFGSSPGARAFALLVLGVRRAGKLATAMEARGFGADRERTWARPARWAGGEWAMLGIGCAVGGVCTVAALVAGSWNLVVA